MEKRSYCSIEIVENGILELFSHSSLNVYSR